MKKITVLTSYFPVMSETFVGNEIRALRNHGHEVQVIAFKRSNDQAQHADLALVSETLFLSEQRHLTQWIASPKILVNLPSALPFIFEQKGLSPRSLLWNSIKLANAVNKAGSKHIHAHFAHATTAHAIVAAKLLGITVSFVGHGSDIYVKPIDLDKKLNHCNFVVAVCDQMRKDFLSLTRSDKIKRIDCGINPEGFRPRNSVDGNGRFLFVGRLTNSKGIDLIIRAIASLPESQRPHVDIVGQGQLEVALKELTWSLGVVNQVKFLGPKDSEWIMRNGPEYLAFIAPFKQGCDGAKDTGPVVVKEAMAMGLPVISTRFMGVTEMVSEECGILVEVDDIYGLACAISTLKGLAPDIRTKMGMRGRQRVLEKFTCSKQAAALSMNIEAI